MKKGHPEPPVSTGRDRLSRSDLDEITLSSQSVLSSGTDASSKRVYGWYGGFKTAPNGPCSTTRPAYNTTTRSAKDATVERS